MSKQRRTIRDLTRQLEPSVRRAFLEAIESVQSASQLRLIIGHLEQNNIQAAVTALRLDRSFFAPLDRAWSEVFYQGGVSALANLPRISDPFLGAELSSALMRVLIARNGLCGKAQAN